MGAYGGTSAKPTYVWSNDAGLLSLLPKPFARSTFKATVSTVTVKTIGGNKTVSGTKALKSTQHGAYAYTGVPQLLYAFVAGRHSRALVCGPCFPELLVTIVLMCLTQTQTPSVGCGAVVGLCAALLHAFICLGVAGKPCRCCVVITLETLSSCLTENVSGRVRRSCRQSPGWCACRSSAWASPGTCGGLPAA